MAKDLGDLDDDQIEAMMNKRRERLLNDRATKQKELDAIEKELRRTESWLNPPADVASTTRKTREQSTRAKPGELSDLQKRIVAVVRNHLPEGPKSDAIYGELGARSTEEKRPIDAALNRMKNQGVLNQKGRKQPYTLGPNVPAEADAHPQSGV